MKSSPLALLGLGLGFFARFVLTKLKAAGGKKFASIFWAQTSAKLSPPNQKTWLRPCT